MLKAPCSTNVAEPGAVIEKGRRLRADAAHKADSRALHFHGRDGEPFSGTSKPVGTERCRESARPAALGAELPNRDLA